MLKQWLINKKTTNLVYALSNKSERPGNSKGESIVEPIWLEP
jgi:hypothetical protein